MAQQPQALLCYGYNLGDPYNDWLYAEAENIDPDDIDGMVDAAQRSGRMPGVQIELHGYGWEGKALALAGRSFTHDYGWSDPVDPGALAVSDGDRQFVVDAAQALGVTFPRQPGGPGWLLLPVLDE